MPDSSSDLLPVCFMVMPFRKKKIDDPKGADAPNELDCDALWDKAFRPAIVDLGYLPIRADYDSGSVIVKDMLERLAFADLVIADVSLPNGNVYYEVGLRHVAKDTNCVLLAASWSRQLFDIDQFTSIRYELKDGNVPDGEAEVIRKRITEAVPKLKNSATPWHEFIAGSEDEMKRKGVFRDHAERLSSFQANVREARLVKEGELRKLRILDIQKKFTGTALELSDVAVELLRLIRDEVGWKETLTFVEHLPESTKKLPFIKEQYLLALAKLGKPEEAIAKLEELIANLGSSPERQGLIGGRYKQLWLEAVKARLKNKEDRPSLQEKQYLEKAIEHYTNGMLLDYNQYYCSCNIPQLLRTRGKKGDVERAQVVDHFVIAACDRALSLGEGDEWLRPTLLGSAFRAGDVEKAEELAERVALEGGARWNLDSLFPDLEVAVSQTEDEEVKVFLLGVYEDLKRLMTESRSAEG